MMKSLCEKCHKNICNDHNHQTCLECYTIGSPMKPATTIRFFNRVDFYTVHGSDAIFTAKEFFKTTSFIKTYTAGTDTLESLTLNKSNFEAFVRELLLVKHYRVEVYVCKGGIKSNNWSLEYKGSPGNLSQFEDVLFDNVDQVEGTSVIAIKIGSDPNTKSAGKITGLALIDFTEQCMSVCEYADDEYFSNTETLIVQLAAKECLLISENSQELVILKKVVERSGVLVTTRKKTDFNTDNLSQDINRLIKFEEGQQENAMALPQMNLLTATGALASIIKYLELTSNPENFSKFRMEFINHSRFVHLDTAAMNALSLMPLPGSSTQNKHHSVFGLLDKCRTPHGHRLLMQWVRQPLRDINIINERHDIVETLVSNVETRQELYDDHLRRIPDLQTLCRKLQRNKVTLQDCYKIYQGVKKLPELLECLKSCNDHNPHSTLKFVLIDPLEEHTTDMKKFQEMLESTLDMNLVDRGEFLIKSEFSEELQDMRQKMDKVELKMKSELSRVASSLRLQENKTVKLESNSQYGHFFRVTTKDYKIISGNSEYELLDTHKSGMKFRNQRLSNLNNDYIDMFKEYSEQQKTIIAEMIEIASGYCNTLQYLSALLAMLDVLTSFAIVATCAPTPFVRPKMLPMGSGVFALSQARHPCVEMQDGVSFIPNDVFFKQGECTLNIITGPNMGGKSTYIRSVGVIALLAHIGSFVSCNNAEIPVFDTILARVGANDSQIKRMSTFMVEMVETSSIIQRATSNSLVIIDELGRGTSTYEGCGIACSIVEHLAKDLKPFSLFATHFHELTLLSEEIATIHNLHVSAIISDDTLTNLYQIKKGPCDQSFGIHVAKMAKFPSHVIQDGERRLKKMNDLMDFEVTGVSNEQKSKLMQEGEKIIDEFVSSCKELEQKRLSDEEFTQNFKMLKQSVLVEDNAYINALLCK